MRKAFLIILAMAAIINFSLFQNLMAGDDTITIQPKTELPKDGILKTFFGFNFAGQAAWVDGLTITGYGNTPEVCRMTMARNLRSAPSIIKNYLTNLLADIDCWPEATPFWMNVYGRNVPVIAGSDTAMLALGDRLQFTVGGRSAGYCIILGDNKVGFCGIMNGGNPVIGLVPIYGGYDGQEFIQCLVNDRPCRINGLDSLEYEFGKSYEIKELKIK